VKPAPEAKSEDSLSTFGRPTLVVGADGSAGKVIVEGMRSLVRSASLLRAMTVTHLKMRYRYSFLGWGWGLLQPLTLMLLYSLVFSHLVDYVDHSLPYPLFIFAGLTPWAFCSTSISTSAAGMLSHRSLMAAVYFPREIVPISFVVASLIDPAIALVALLLMMGYFLIPIPVTILLIIPIFAVLTVLVAAVCLLVSSIQVRIRDIGVALPLVLQVLMFTAPIVYPASAVPAALRYFYWFNPFAILVEGFRSALIGKTLPHVDDMLYAAAVAIVCFVAAYWVFKKIEPTIVDDM